MIVKVFVVVMSIPVVTPAVLFSRSFTVMLTVPPLVSFTIPAAVTFTVPSASPFPKTAGRCDKQNAGKY